MGKLQLSLFIAFSFVIVSVFGFFAMANEMDHGNCIAKTLQGTVCTETDIFGVAAYHLSAFAKAGRAVLASSLTSFLTLIFLAVAFLAFADPSILPPRLRFACFSRLDNSDRSQKFALRRWLSFHENSPNIAVGI